MGKASPDQSVYTCAKGENVTASAEHIKAMVRSHASGDDAQFYAIALQVAARSARQGHQKAATELKELRSRVDDVAVPRPKGS
jgi:hypothetical protein